MSDRDDKGNPTGHPHFSGPGKTSDLPEPTPRSDKYGDGEGGAYGLGNRIKKEGEAIEE